MSGDPRWTEETEVLAAKAFLRLAYAEGGYPDTVDEDWEHPSDPEGRDDALRAARATLAALADAGLLVTPSTSDAPRTWGIDPEPGPEVTAVREPDGQIWKRFDTGAPPDGTVGERWWYPAGSDPRDDGTDWDELVAVAWPGRLTDATGEVQQ